MSTLRRVAGRIPRVCDPPPGRYARRTPMSNEPPARPTKLEDLRFKRRPPVQWFSPPTLARAAAKVILAAAFGDYLDKREMQGTLGDAIFAIDPDADDLWFDFVADTGDGFNST